MIDVLIYAGFAALSFVVASVIIGWGIPHLRRDGGMSEVAADAGADGGTRAPAADTVPKRVFDWLSTGFWIGACEVLLVFPLVCHGEYSALAIIFGAKEYVRKEKIQQNPSHYLLGTLVNLSIAVLFALLARRVVQANQGCCLPCHACPR
jgi:hypothetical protein